jgi:predicted ATPase/DNA-binding winged helix-turn-helix (wHTH) protein
MTPYRFGRFGVDRAARQLLVDGEPVALGARAFDVLLALIERRERVVTKHELLEIVWPGLVVEENNLQVQVSALRKQLGPHVIATIPGRGYQFVARLVGTSDTAAPAGAWNAAATPWAANDPPATTNVPQDLPALYGRDVELAALEALVAARRLVTIVGAGGIGKSRIAQAVAQRVASRWGGGAWMIEIAGLFEPARLPHAVAQPLQIPLAGVRPAIDELIAALAGRSLLIVIDNCEHLLDAVADLVHALLAALPGLHLLLTSQEPTRLPAEQQYRIQPLAVPIAPALVAAREYGALALFEARVRAVDSRFALSDASLPLAIDICRRLDGLPLAIELAAARVATLGVQAVRDRLDARFMLLSGGSRAVLRRHQTLRAALEWSHNLLDDEERLVFRRLGVFAGGFTMELAQRVVADDRHDEWAVLETLSALVDKSLVVADAGAAPRYRLLESARAYALEQLARDDVGETAAMLRRHALAIVDFIRHVDDRNLDGELRTDQYAALVMPELDNLRAAYAWASGPNGDPAIAVTLAAHAGSLIDYASEASEWLLPLVGFARQGNLPAEVEARYWRALAAANMSNRLPRLEQLEAAQRARALYEKLGSPRRVFSCTIQVARHRNMTGDPVGARAALDEARAMLRPEWASEFRIAIVRLEGSLARNDRRYDDALRHFREERGLAHAQSDWRLETIARVNLVDVLWAAGSIAEAADEAEALAREIQSRPMISDVDNDLAFANVLGILSELDRPAEALRYARDGLAVMRRTKRECLEAWICLLWRLGDLGRAALLLGRLDASTQPPSEVNELRLLAAVRVALERELPAADLDRKRVAGAALTREEAFEIIDAALAERDAASNETD